MFFLISYSKFNKLKKIKKKNISKIFYNLSKTQQRQFLQPVFITEVFLTESCDDVK